VVYSHVSLSWRSQDAVAVCMYNGKLDIVPQADRHAVTLLDSNVLKAACQGVTSLIQLAICQALLLVPHNDSATAVNSVPSHRHGNGLGRYERWTVTVGRHDLGEVLRDSILEQGRL